MGNNVLSDIAYRGVADKARAAGSATYAGQERHRAGLGLHELVDPKGFDLIRRSISWLEPKGKRFELLRGVAMLEETRLDTTGSMGRNVEVAMRVLPDTYKLLATGKHPVLGRYDTQMITSIFGDAEDHYILARSQAEVDERIAIQMTYMMPEGGGGGNGGEDPQYGLFGAAYLTDANITKYGLKSYDFTITDEPGRMRLSHDLLVRVFGEKVYEKTAENGFPINKNNLPDTAEIVRSLLERAHAFLLLVGNRDDARVFWPPIYGPERIIRMPHIDLLPYVKAAIIGLTEGTLDLQNMDDFLQEAGVNADDVKLITRAVAHIPIGAQAELENFDKIPLKGTIFAKKGDLWPIDLDVELAGDDDDDPDTTSDTADAASDKIWA